MCWAEKREVDCGLETWKGHRYMQSLEKNATAPLRRLLEKRLYIVRGYNTRVNTASYIHFGSAVGGGTS